MTGPWTTSWESRLERLRVIKWPSQAVRAKAPTRESLRIRQREMRPNDRHTSFLDVGQGGGCPNATADDLLSLAAAPTFAAMALLTGIQDGGMPGMLCLAAHDASLWTGMVPMYLLMGVFHSTAWLRLIAAWRKRAPE